MRFVVRTPRSSLRRGKAKQGNTFSSSGTTQEPRLPHERDESADNQATTPAVSDERIRKAHEDLQRGVVDTDKGPVLESLASKKYPAK